MKYAFALAAAGTLVAAQDFAGIPTCAVPCLETGIPLVGCALTDTACQCQPSIQSAIQINPTIVGCLTSNCAVSDLFAAQSAAASDCSAFFATAGSSSATATGSSSGTTGSASAPSQTSTAVVSSNGTLSTTASLTIATAASPTSSSPSSVSTGAAAVYGVSGALAVFLGAVAAL